MVAQRKEGERNEICPVVDVFVPVRMKVCVIALLVTGWLLHAGAGFQIEKMGGAACHVRWTKEKVKKEEVYFLVE